MKIKKNGGGKSESFVEEDWDKLTVMRDSHLNADRADELMEYQIVVRRPTSRKFVDW